MCRVTISCFVVLSGLLGSLCPWSADARAADAPALDIRDIRIRDPFVLTDAANGRYVMVASMGNRRPAEKGWECYTSKDLCHWQAPAPVFTPPAGFWADRDFWAPEIHAHRGKFYLFGTLSAHGARRGTQILAADQPLGPYRPHSDRAATPHDWMALDGTLHVEKGQAWMVFCHEWVQIKDGTMDAVRLSEDLSKPIGEPIRLFRASDAPWCRPVQPGKYVTDGPFLHRLKGGGLLMLWSSFSDRGYAVGIARSESGTIQGPWKHDPKPLHEGGGHAMMFAALDGKPMLVLHEPNDSPKERARFFQVHEEPDTIRLGPAAATVSAGPEKAHATPDAAPKRATEVSIRGESFYLQGKPTYAGRAWRGQRIEGLLFNARLVQGIFDDLNPETVGRWAYPDTGRWDADRNTREFVAAMPEWRRHGLLCFTINLQGGSPQGYSREQPWHNSAITPEGTLRPAYMARLEKVLDRADELGMVVILGIFYFGQDQRLRDEAAVLRAVDAAVDWVYARGYRNVLVEINNECNVNYDHAVLRPDRVHELIERVKRRGPPGPSGAPRPRLLASTSYGGGAVPKENVVRAADFLLMHGNGVSKPERIAAMVRQCRQTPGYRPMPILFNEDDHFDFDKPQNNLLSAVGEYASWGYFDPGKSDYRDGYQCPPVNWQINTPRKKAFFGLVREITAEKK